MNNKTNINKNFITSNAGLKIYSNLWNRYSISHILDSVSPKISGSPTSKIMQNLFFRNLIDTNSMTALSEKDKEEYFLQKNASLDRTTYGRNLNKLNNEQRQKILLRFNNSFIKQEYIDEDALMIYDTTAIEAEGETYENTKQVYDSCQEKMVQGYALNKLILSTKKKLTVIDFDLQNENKDKTIEMFKKGRRLFGINKIVIDAGPDIRGMDFYKKLDEENFLFYTKAVSNWYFNYGKDYTVEQLMGIVKPRLKKEGVVSLEVWKDDMLLRLIFVLNDPRVYLTNDLEIATGKVIQYYKRRWGIEVSFKEEKQNLGLEILPTRKEDGIKTHILLVLLAFILSQLILDKRKVSKNNTRKCFVLKADIKHYFETVNHKILLNIIRKKIKISNSPFSSQKTLQLYKKGLSIQEIAKHRGIKESTVWEHLAKLIEYNQLSVWKVLPKEKIMRILSNINNSDDKLKDIKQKMNDNSITFDEINCVLTHIKNKTKGKATPKEVNDIILRLIEEK